MAQEPDKTLLNTHFLRYWLATRPNFLAASLIPVLIGAAAVAHRGGKVSVLLLLLTLLATALVHAGVNVLNDYYDDENGTDRCNTQRIFPFTGGSRFIQNGVLSAGETFVFGASLLSAAMLLGVGLAWVSGMGLLWIGLAGLLLGWGYSASPLRLNSRGLGEPAVAIGFGILTPLVEFKAGMILRENAQQPAALEPAIKMTIASMVLHGMLLTLTLWLV
jgi:1,4-dihydroxy-2-naphthoate octaprenyltransferase